MKKVYMIMYISVDKYSFSYQEDVTFDKVSFADYRAASYFLINMGYEPYCNSGRGNGRFITWENQYGDFAKIEELTIIQ